MRKNIVICAVAAVLGAVSSVPFWKANLAVPSANAQGPAFPVQIPATTRLEPVGQPGNVPLGMPVRPRAMPDDELTPEEQVNVAVYENVNRSVVNIVTKIPRTSGFLLFDNSAEGAGSGSVLDKNGDILTNYHVIEGANLIKVTLFDGSSFDARLVGRDISSDIAVLRIDARPELLYPVTFGDSSRLHVGQKVLAIGNPFGLERTLTTGIVSSLNRTLPSRNNRSIKSIIQIDAAINPGNSGGPLLNGHGHLIGMNTAIASSTGENTGVGFAIPVNIIARVVPQLIEKGHVVRPETGITRVYQTGQGLQVATMAPGGPAEQAGLRGFRIVKQLKRQGPISYETETIDRGAADLIVGVNGEKILTADEFLNAIESFHPGDVVNLNVIRDGHEIAVRLRLTAAES